MSSFEDQDACVKQEPHRYRLLSYTVTSPLSIRIACPVLLMGLPCSLSYAAISFSAASITSGFCPSSSALCLVHIRFMFCSEVAIRVKRIVSSFLFACLLYVCYVSYDSLNYPLKGVLLDVVVVSCHDIFYIEILYNMSYEIRFL